jgi:hypothetical protein
MSVLRIGNGTREGATGSITAVVCYVDEPNTPMLLSASHVLAPSGAAVGDAIVDAASMKQIATLLTWTGVSIDVGYPNVADAALAVLAQNLDPESLFVHAVRHPFAQRSPLPDAEVTLAGVGSTARLRDPSRDCLIPWSSCELGYTAHLLTEAFTTPGDSGAALLDTGGQLVGMVVGITDPQSDLGLQCTAATPIAAIAGHSAWRGKRLQPYGLPAAPPPMAGVPIPADDPERTLTLTLWGEARGEPPWQGDPDAGMKAVACVVLNRVKSRRSTYGLTIADVCTKRAQSSKYGQFSCWNADDPNFAKFLTANLDAAYPRAEAVARLAIAGTLSDITQGATHYFDPRYASPGWAIGHTPCVKIGNQVFFNDIA